MHRFGDALPAVELLGAVQAGHISVTLRLVADRRGFSDQETCRGALGIVLGHQCGRNGVGRAVARQRRHHDAVGKLQVTSLDGVE